ncbi:glycosyltransferase family 2 protein [Polynucleobacter sp. UK-Mo-2m-Kol15]|uniref:glycosyltransferase family 2 protein n=1 Tax=Polynucleobacter sp. UK-Mo-2m-Kol15 TaxID=2576916 RepID=UPI001C0CD8AF|nr:glycosyltransferase family 2 protein [Polynucleobacter sp. UK-Mo-2m-Kol15]MBU3574774.1 glycosyltransferase family 2 protein [Polynucleobacter sp. UK-Mo-2m-Kol15]
MKFELHPLANVIATTKNGYTWLAKNDDPQFSILNWESLQGRAVRLTLQIKSDAPIISAPVIYFDDGAGMSEANIISLKADEQGFISQDIAFSDSLCGIRFDPIARSGLFSLLDLHIHFLSYDAKEIAGLIENQRAAKVDAYMKQSIPEIDYQKWIDLNEIPSSRYKALSDEINQLTASPLISIVMPTYETPIDLLRAAIDSVINQVYENWELCIADDYSKSPQIKEVLNEYKNKDHRIKFLMRDENGHICEASNSALGMASGDFVALLDHDDELHPLALFYIAKSVIEFPEVSLFYSDEDKISVDGCRSNPYFKCDFNYDLFLSQNMICHLSAYRLSLIRDLGGFRCGLEGAQDYDLALRVLDAVGVEGIKHIPRVLYHWRIIPQSTSSSHEAKPYAVNAGENAIKNHLQRNSIRASIDRPKGAPGYHQVSYEIEFPQPCVEIIIPTRDSVHLVRQCIDSILENTTYPNYRITLIDNGSVEDESLKYFESLQSDYGVSVIRDDSPFNYSRINNNIGLNTSADLICLLNNDIEVITPQWLTEMVSIALQPKVGAVGAKLLYPNETLQHAGVILGIGGVAGHSHKFFPRSEPGYFSRAILRNTLSAVTAACLVIRASIFKEVGGLDENLQIAFNDIDFCLRVREMGYRNVWTPFAELYHHESATRGHEDTPEKKVRFDSEVSYMKNRWGNSLSEDPYYSPNLTLESENFAVAWYARV